MALEILWDCRQRAKAVIGWPGWRNRWRGGCQWGTLGHCDCAWRAHWQGTGEGHIRYWAPEWATGYCGGRSGRAGRWRANRVCPFAGASASSWGRSRPRRSSRRRRRSGRRPVPTSCCAPRSAAPPPMPHSGRTPLTSAICHQPATKCYHIIFNQPWHFSRPPPMYWIRRIYF